MSELLVIGYGNTLREDDQAGPLAVEMVESLGLPGVVTRVCPQLSLEHAEALADAGAVVFVDAQAGPGGKVNLRRVLPGHSQQVTTHAIEPRALLSLVRDIYGRVPRAWLLTIPAERFGIGTELSTLTRRGIAVAVAKVVKLAQDANPHGHSGQVQEHPP